MRNTAIALVLLIFVAYAACGRIEAPIDAAQCDILAADPDDVTSEADGVPDGEIRPARAIRACEAAVKEEPANVRYLIQLGRAYYAAGRLKDAQTQWEKALKTGSSAAAFHLARLRMTEYWTLAETNEVQARQVLDEIADLLEPAVDYPPARVLLDALIVRPADFRMRTLVRLLLTGDFARINRARLVAAWWVQGVQESMSQPFHPDCQAFPAKLVQPVIVRALDKAEAGDPNHLAEALVYKGGKWAGSWALFLTDFVWAGDPVKWRNWVKEIGVMDGLALSKNYCDTPAAQEFYRQIVHFANTPLALSEYANDLRTLRSIKDVLPEVMPYIDKAPIGATLEVDSDK